MGVRTLQARKRPSVHDNAYTHTRPRHRHNERRKKVISRPLRKGGRKKNSEKKKHEEKVAFVDRDRHRTTLRMTDFAFATKPKNDAVMKRKKAELQKRRQPVQFRGYFFYYSFLRYIPASPPLSSVSSVGHLYSSRSSFPALADHHIDTQSLALRLRRAFL